MDRNPLQSLKIITLWCNNKVDMKKFCKNHTAMWALFVYFKMKVDLNYALMG